MWICRCQPMSASRLPNAITSSIVRALAEMVHVMEAHAAEALRVAPLELGIGDIDRHQRHAADRRRLWRRARRRWRQGRSRARRCARSRSARCRETYGARTASPSARRTGSVAAAEGKARARPEHMHVRVAGARRQLQFRLARRRRPGRRDGGGVGGMRSWAILHEAGARVRSKAGSCAANARASRPGRDRPARQSTCLRQSR